MDTKNLESTGVWWLPANQAQRIAGTFAFSPDEGLRLRLVGSFKDVTALPETTQYPIVAGVAPRQLFTLYDCLERGSQLSFPGLITQRLSPSVAFIGAHFTDPSELRFHIAEVQYTYLAEWGGISGFQFHATNSQTAGQPLVQVSYTRPPEMKAQLQNATILFRHSFNTERDLPEALTLRQSAWLRIESQDDLTLDDWLRRFISPLQNFVSLASGQANFIEQLLVYTLAKKMGGPKGETREIPIQVLFRQPYSELHADRRSSVFDPLFTLTDIKDQFEGILTQWLAFSDALAAPLNVFFAVQYDRRMHLEHQFLNVVQAAESYHRRRIGNEVLLEADHEKRLTQILAAAPGEHREWLAGLLAYSNEPRLRRRLHELISRGGPAALKVVGNAQKFVQSVVATRNFLTHLDPKLGQQAAQGADLYWLTQKLSFVLRACYLVELGLSEKKIQELVGRNQDYGFAAHH